MDKERTIEDILKEVADSQPFASENDPLTKIVEKYAPHDEATSDSSVTASSSLDFEHLLSLARTYRKKQSS